MKLNKSTVRALQVIRRRVRFTDAHLQLPGSNANDRDAIREATRIYVETWIVSLLDAIEQGRTRDLAEWTRGEKGDMPEPHRC